MEKEPAFTDKLLTPRTPWNKGKLIGAKCNRQGALFGAITVPIMTSGGTITATRCWRALRGAVSIRAFRSTWRRLTTFVKKTATSSA